MTIWQFATCLSKPFSWGEQAGAGRAGMLGGQKLKKTNKPTQNNPKRRGASGKDLRLHLTHGKKIIKSDKNAIKRFPRIENKIFRCSWKLFRPDKKRCWRSRRLAMQFLTSFSPSVHKYIYPQIAVLVQYDIWLQWHLVAVDQRRVLQSTSRGRVLLHGERTHRKKIGLSKMSVRKCKANQCKMHALDWCKRLTHVSRQNICLSTQVVQSTGHGQAEFPAWAPLCIARSEHINPCF